MYLKREIYASQVLDYLNTQMNKKSHKKWLIIAINIPRRRSRRLYSTKLTTF